MTPVPPHAVTITRRRLLRIACGLALFYSSMFAGFGLILAGQYLNEEIPAGRIASVGEQTKSGVMLRLDNGREVLFPNLAIYSQTPPVVLSVGDRVEKERDSAVCTINGRRLTDAGWLTREQLFPVHLQIVLGAYLLLSAVYVFLYARTPIGEMIWPETAPKRPRKPRTAAGRLAIVPATWLISTVLVYFVFSCAAACLFGLGRAVGM